MIETLLSAALILALLAFAVQSARMRWWRWRFNAQAHEIERARAAVEQAEKLLDAREWPDVITGKG